MMMDTLELLRLILTHVIDDIYMHEHQVEFNGTITNDIGVSYVNRIARKTPKKPGYFLSFWQKDENNKNTPFTSNDAADYLVVVINTIEEQGYFVFPRSILEEKGILKTNKHKGKMGFRIYTKDDNLNPTAQKTYEWMQPFYTPLAMTQYLESLHRVLNSSSTDELNE